MTTAVFLDWAALAATLGGTAIGGLIDLKTTEVPDAVPLGMAVAGLAIHLSRFFLLGDISSLVWGIAVAGAFLAFGYALYFTGQWGEADVLLLGAIGFLIPQPLSMFTSTGIVMGVMFPLIYLLNMFVTGAAYSVVYAMGMAVKTPEIFANFGRELRKKAKNTVIISAAILAASSAIFFYIISIGHPVNITLPILVVTPLVISMLLLYRFAVVLERIAFRKRIATSKLKVGDVLAEDVRIGKKYISSKLYIGLTREQINALRKVRTKVTIKEGVRYSPVFFLSVLVTWGFGNLLWPLFAILL